MICIGGADCNLLLEKMALLNLLFLKGLGVGIFKDFFLPSALSMLLAVPMSSRFPVGDGSIASHFIYGFLPLHSQISWRISL